MKEHLNPQLVGKVVERLRALADENRIHLLLRLRKGPCNVNTLVNDMAIAQASVSKHLAVLKRVGLIEVTRQGTQAIYRIHDETVFNLCQIVCDGVIRHVREEHAVLETTPRVSTSRPKPLTRRTRR